MFGADEIIIDTKDTHIEQNIRSVIERFGGHFQIRTGISGLQVVKKWEGTIVHLTMYGEQLDKAIPEIDPKKNLLIIVGAEKVPAEYYEYADINVSVGNQPHSEVAALALFLDRYTKGAWQQQSFHGSVVIQPSKKEKQVHITKHHTEEKI
jgi:tRNA (cytidine56-2'-O)-methyltransferase